MDGILIINKPQGCTSHDIVNLVRRRFALKKVGHAGTLDPMATGVLIILIGRYTKSSPLFLNEEKEYEGRMVLGATSDTGDAWGKITASGKPVETERAGIESVFSKFLGPIKQRPPMFSAVKVKGRKMYELARKGLTVEVEPRTVSVKMLEITSISLPEISFKVVCSKGTYVRQLCADIGEELGCGGYLSMLKRTRSGGFSIGQALDIEGLKSLNAAELEKRLLKEPYDGHKRIAETKKAG